MSRKLHSCFTLALVLGLGACGPAGRDEPPAPAVQVAEEEAPATPVIDIEATEYAFTAPPTFPSGWVTLRFENAGRETHFLLLWRLPEDKTFEDYASEIAQPFNAGYEKYRAGELERDEFLERLGETLPEWFGSVERFGGPGFTAPGRTSHTTVRLEPGEYVMECYVRAAEQHDTFHGSLGMLRPLIVTSEASRGTPPGADLEIALSNYEISVAGAPTRGEQTVRVRIEEDPEGLILHNVHLARLEHGDIALEAAAWLDWVDAMLPPAGVEFLGGAGQAQAGSESYFTVDLAPGRYAWVSEAWGIGGMVREFTVE